MTTILGVNAYHPDAAACLLKDGELVGAVEEERFRRIKHWEGFPSQSITWCLREGGIRLADLDHVAVNRDPKAGWGQRLAYVLRQRPSLRVLAGRLRDRRRLPSVRSALEESFPGERLRAQLHQVEHHVCHLASAALLAPFSKCAVLSVDQFGDFSSCAWGLAQGGEIEVLGRVHYPHSLGTFYTALTQFLGFPHFGDEYKVMGLAPYGEPTYLPQLRRVIELRGDGFELDLDCFVRQRTSVFASNGGAPRTDVLFSSRLEDLLGPRRHPDEPLTQRHKDLSCSIQARYEEVFFGLLARLAQQTGLTRLALAGGCAANSAANGKIHQRSPFSEVFVHPAPGDAGGAVGAALQVWQRLQGTPVRPRHAFLGPSYGPDAIDAALAGVELSNCQVDRLEDEALLGSVASRIADGAVVGWFQGRLEWGPRALGNRSIVCDPRRADMRELLNAKIKRRESFRPFAPSILREAVGEWFETEADVPFMSRVFRVREEKRGEIPAVTHVDGTGRLQTVTREANARFYGLIEAFRELTEVPILLNTSFNENEPIVCQPKEALDCFLRTDMDVLVLGNVVVSRSRG